MVNKLSTDWYKSKVQTVLSSYLRNTSKHQELLALLKDRGLKSIDKQLVSLFQEKAGAVDSSPSDPDRWRAYHAAAKAVSESPWRTLQRFVDLLPLENMFPLAVENIAVRHLFLEKLRTIDDQNRAAAHSAQKSMKDFINALSDGVVPCRQTPPGKGRMPKPRTNDLPHPLGAILRRSTAGGGRLGSTHLARELDTYCTKQLLEYVRHSKRAKKALSGKPTPAHLGKAHAIGILTTIFTPRKAAERLKEAIEDIELGQTELVFQITAKEIEVFLSKTHVVSYLRSLI
jgi:hypothetical protein